MHDRVKNTHMSKQLVRYFAHISVYTNQYLKYQARKGALFDEYQFEIRAEEDPIHGATPTVLQVSSACGQQVI